MGAPNIRVHSFTHRYCSRCGGHLSQAQPAVASTSVCARFAVTAAAVAAPHRAAPPPALPPPVASHSAVPPAPPPPVQDQQTVL